MRINAPKQIDENGRENPYFWEEQIQYETTKDILYNNLVVECSEALNSVISKQRLQDVLKEILQKLTPGQLADFLEKI